VGRFSWLTAGAELVVAPSRDAEFESARLLGRTTLVRGRWQPADRVLAQIGPELSLLSWRAGAHGENELSAWHALVLPIGAEPLTVFTGLAFRHLVPP